MFWIKSCVLTTPSCEDDDDMLEKLTQFNAKDRREPMASIAVLMSIRTKKNIN